MTGEKARYRYKRTEPDSVGEFATGHVMLANAGIQRLRYALDSRFRGNDDIVFRVLRRLVPISPTESEPEL